MGCVAGAVRTLPGFISLQNQRYWSKYIQGCVSANPGSRLTEGRRGELLLIAAPKLPTVDASAVDTAPVTNSSSVVKDLLRAAPPAQITIRNFGYASPDPPPSSAYGLLGLVFLTYTAVPFLCPHAVAWIVTGFRAKPSAQL
jgi:hypothetical protein